LLAGAGCEGAARGRPLGRPCSGEGGSSLVPDEAAEIVG